SLGCEGSRRSTMAPVEPYSHLQSYRQLIVWLAHEYVEPGVVTSVAISLGCAGALTSKTCRTFRGTVSDMIRTLPFVGMSSDSNSKGSSPSCPQNVCDTSLGSRGFDTS